MLYRKKDDDSLVILKEINLMELSKQERSLALNEVLLPHVRMCSLSNEVGKGKVAPVGL